MKTEDIWKMSGSERNDGSFPFLIVFTQLILEGTRLVHSKSALRFLGEEESQHSPRTSR